jgi:hypothetical protein
VFRVDDEMRCDAEAQARAARASPPLTGASCDDALTEFRELFNFAQATYAAIGARNFARASRGLIVEWDRYVDEARAQTPLELFINTRAFRRTETANAGFRPPPNRQWIALHPGLVIENVSEAVDGEDTIQALMIELVGMNWWRQQRAYVPSGFSIVSVYSDRPGVSDVGYGIALHFRSVYTLGFTNHNGDDGVFVSFDLLKLLQDKQKVLEAYGR